MHKQIRKKFPKIKITLEIDDCRFMCFLWIMRNQWAADLVILSNYSDKNDDFKYILNVIDKFSKYVYIQPLKRKKELRCYKSFFNYNTRHN